MSECCVLKLPTQMFACCLFFPQDAMTSFVGDLNSSVRSRKSFTCMSVIGQFFAVCEHNSLYIVGVMFQIKEYILLIVGDRNIK